MNRSNLLIGIALLVIAGAVGFLLFAPAGGGKAPQVSFTTLNGDKLDLGDLKGQPVLVSFWATTCPGCIKEMPHLVELHNELAPKGLKIIGVAMAYDPPEQVSELVRRKQLPYTIALDSTGAISAAFGDVRLTPTNFLISPEGLIVMQKLGDLNMQKLMRQIKTMLKEKA